MAEELALPLLGEIPLYPPVMQGGETGAPIVVSEPDSPAGRALRGIADRIMTTMGAPAAA